MQWTGKRRLPRDEIRRETAVMSLARFENPGGRVFHASVLHDCKQGQREARNRQLRSSGFAKLCKRAIAQVQICSIGWDSPAGQFFVSAPRGGRLVGFLLVYSSGSFPRRLTSRRIAKISTSHRKMEANTGPGWSSAGMRLTWYARRGPISRRRAVGGVAFSYPACASPRRVSFSRRARRGLSCAASA